MEQDGIGGHYHVVIQIVIIIRQKGGPAETSNLFTPEQIFKPIMSPQIRNIILREKNRKSKNICDAYNSHLWQKFPTASE